MEEEEYRFVMNGATPKAGILTFIYGLLKADTKKDCHLTASTTTVIIARKIADGQLHLNKRIIAEIVIC